MQSEDDVERLEWNVQNDQRIRDQYVTFLRNIKRSRKDLTEVFADVFSDEALTGYNYNGKTNQAKKKKTMKNYSIFTDCMIDAWQPCGATEEVLRLAIVKVIARMNHKLRSRRYRSKSSNNVIMLDDDDDDDDEVQIYEVA